MSTVVLVGSLGSTSEMWDPQLPVLGGRSVVRLDHPGHGGEPVRDVHDIGDLAAHVLDQVDGTFSFIGLSLGGAIGMHIALHTPERLEKLVLASTATRFGEPEQWIARAATVRAEGMSSIVDAILPRWFTPAFPDVAMYREMMLSIDPEGYARCCEALSRFDVRDEVGAIRAPTLAIAGTDDPTTPPDVVEVIAQAIRGSRFDVLGPGGHIINVERAAEFNHLLEEFL
jgi:3-oxoadipate enol-lactonase/4-carboxymuconolactone decarboxylase